MATKTKKKPRQDDFRPTIQDLLMEGLTMAEAFMTMEAIASCGIEGIRLDKEGFKKLCKSVKNDRCGRRKESR